MKSIEEYTDYLFNCSFTDDSFDPENHEEHLRASWELFEHYAWKDIFPIWIKYLHSKCPTPEDVINFVNLYVYYEASDRPLDDPIEFIGYLYSKVDIDKYWDQAGELSEGLAINMLSRQWLINIMKDPYYVPLKDERILSAISKWKNNNAESNHSV